MRACFFDLMRRYLIVWQPFIIIAAKGVNHAFGLQ